MIKLYCGREFPFLSMYGPFYGNWGPESEDNSPRICEWVPFSHDPFFLWSPRLFALDLGLSLQIVGKGAAGSRQILCELTLPLLHIRHFQEIVGQLKHTGVWWPAWFWWEETSDNVSVWTSFEKLNSENLFTSYCSPLWMTLLPWLWHMAINHHFLAPCTGCPVWSLIHIWISVFKKTSLLVTTTYIFSVCTTIYLKTFSISPISLSFSGYLDKRGFTYDIVCEANTEGRQFQLVSLNVLYLYE